MLLKLSVTDNSKRAIKQQFSNDATLLDLKEVIRREFLVEDVECDILQGFPPKPLCGSNNEQLIKFGLTHGEHITIKVNLDKRTTLLRLTEELGVDKSIALEAMRLVPSSDVELLREICQQLAEESILLSSPKADAAVRVERKVIDADNSCLFNAIGYLHAQGGIQREDATYFRQIVAQVVLSDPEQYSETLLEKPPQQYAEWILDSTKWGGEIELTILSDHLRIEIGAVNISTCAVLVYGERKGYSKRIYLLYDGVHYDAVVATRGNSNSNINSVYSNDGDQQCVVTQFDPADDDVLRAVVELAADLQKKKKFVSLSGSELQCKVCFAVFTGQQQAVAHAKETGHQNFGQVDC